MKKKRKKGRRVVPDYFGKGSVLTVPADAPLPKPLTLVTFGQWLRKNPQPPGPCLLCGRTTAAINIFFPPAHALAGAPAGKERGILYRVCCECEKTGTELERAERIIYARIAQQARLN